MPHELMNMTTSRQPGDSQRKYPTLTPPRRPSPGGPPERSPSRQPGEAQRESRPTLPPHPPSPGGPVERSPSRQPGDSQSKNTTPTTHLPPSPGGPPAWGSATTRTTSPMPHHQPQLHLHPIPRFLPPMSPTPIEHRPGCQPGEESCNDLSLLSAKPATGIRVPHGPGSDPGPTPTSASGTTSSSAPSSGSIGFPRRSRRGATRTGAASCENWEVEARIINGTADHIHILASVPPRLAVAEAVRKVKANSPRWVREQGGEGRFFGWQTAPARLPWLGAMRRSRRIHQPVRGASSDHDV
ncbi:MAG: hypothetical protein FJX77_05045 [Armatimonadetes bacterium]|nr:hypothetical protein [Armatimonadota bacterium]